MSRHVHHAIERNRNVRFTVVTRDRRLTDTELERVIRKYWASIARRPRNRTVELHLVPGTYQ